MVDFFELDRLGIRSARHAGEFVVHTKIVLEGNGGQGLVLPFDLDSLLGLNCLVQTVAPLPPFHQAPSKFIDNDDTTFLDLSLIHI